MDVFASELEFEKTVVNKLVNDCGWKGGVIKNPSEKDLIRNWADILFKNNRSIDRLNDYPLTDGEMNQIIEQIKTLKTPLKLNGFINGKTISIRRDNPDDKLHFGKEVSLKIYDRNEIAGGDSLYQIAEQPRFTTRSSVIADRRGDLMLLINGMPVIHIELKKNGVSVSEACNQISRYSHEGAFSGLFSLVQVFVAMNPSETVYFANPGSDGKFNSDYYFHWADFNNIPINEWDKVVSSLLSIPMAHQLIGFYTVADNTDGILKVMRSYQYYAASAIADRVSIANRNRFEGFSRGGYIWHTTGSGKTMTSFKAAQLISDSGNADKVIFLVDRIELGTQSLQEYQGFADSRQTVQQTENTDVLISKLKSNSPSDTLIVTSIQKMSRIREEGIKSSDLENIREKRIVIIVDECHRDTFGEMMNTVKDTFPNAMFFGFTGTPIFEVNSRNRSTMSAVFGDELHRYSIADGIRDKNVLGFDAYKVTTFRDDDIRREVALDKAKASTEIEAIANPDKAKVFYRFMDPKIVPMAGYVDGSGKHVMGIEDYLPSGQYNTDTHREIVVDDILSRWGILSRGGMFHAIFATNSIHEAFAYYRLFKSRNTPLKITCLVDPNIDNNEFGSEKEDNLEEIVNDYHNMFNQRFTVSTFGSMKKDIALRLAHKSPYTGIENSPDEKLDILIVVDQMLTGFDSKWVNTLYLDKVLRYENVIQAFSRTNRLFNPESKPFGTIRYYRKPHTMEKNIEKAVELYSGNRPLDLFVPKLESNIKELNELYREIKNVFESEGLGDFSKLPADTGARGKFSKLFKQFSDCLSAARIQGFSWKESFYDFDDGRIEVDFSENDYLILALRYKELFKEGADYSFDVPYDLHSYLTEIYTGRIDSDYIDSRFSKYLKTLRQEGSDAESLDAALTELHKSFASLSSEDQKYAELFLHDVQRGDVVPEDGKAFKDYLNEYKLGEKDKKIKNVVYSLGCDEDMLREMIDMKLTDNITEYGRFNRLEESINISKAKEYIEKKEGHPVRLKDVMTKASNLLMKFVMSGGDSDWEVL